jgi:hypothetical protein
MSQSQKVLRAILNGYPTTPEISAATGLPVKHCSAHARDLVRRGLVRDSGPRVPPRNGRGRWSHWYEAAS